MTNDASSSDFRRRRIYFRVFPFEFCLFSISLKGVYLKKCTHKVHTGGNNNYYQSDIYDSASCHVLHWNRISEEFEVQSGVGQNTAVSCFSTIEFALIDFPGCVILIWSHPISSFLFVLMGRTSKPLINLYILKESTVAPNLMLLNTLTELDPPLFFCVPMFFAFLCCYLGVTHEKWPPLLLEDSKIPSISVWFLVIGILWIDTISNEKLRQRTDQMVIGNHIKGNEHWISRWIFEKVGKFRSPRFRTGSNGE